MSKSGFFKMSSFEIPILICLVIAIVSIFLSGLSSKSKHYNDLTDIEAKQLFGCIEDIVNQEFGTQIKGIIWDNNIMNNSENVNVKEGIVVDINSIETAETIKNKLLGAIYEYDCCYLCEYLHDSEIECNYSVSSLHIERCFVDVFENESSSKYRIVIVPIEARIK